MEENNYRPYIWMFEGDMDAHVQDYRRTKNYISEMISGGGLTAMSQFQIANQLLQVQAFVLNGADISQRTVSGLIYEQVSKMRF